MVGHVGVGADCKFHRKMQWVKQDEEREKGTKGVEWQRNKLEHDHDSA